MSRQLSLLHPIVKYKFDKLLQLSKERFNITIKVTQTLRTNEEQYAYWCKGRKTLDEVNAAMKVAGLPNISEAENRVVTRASSAASSFHGYGLAFDIVIVKADGKTITFDDNADVNCDKITDWDQVGSLAEECGLEWGGNFSSLSDKPHYQDRMGWTIAMLKEAKIPVGEVFITADGDIFNSIKRVY